LQRWRKGHGIEQVHWLHASIQESADAPK